MSAGKIVVRFCSRLLGFTFLAVMGLAVAEQLDGPLKLLVPLAVTSTCQPLFRTDVRYSNLANRIREGFFPVALSFRYVRTIHARPH